MPDLSTMSDADLEQIAGQGTPDPGTSLSTMSDADLRRIAGDERPFLEKLGSFARNVIANPPPSVAGIRDIVRDAPAAARELTFGDDPERARAAAGIAAQAAGLGLGFRGLGGEGIAARPIARPQAAVPTPVAVPSEGQAAVEAAARLPGGITLPRYLATESTVIPQVAAGIKNAPWAGQPIVHSADKLTAELARAAGEIAPATTPELAGERARTGLTSFIGSGSQKPVGEAYKAVDALIDPNVRVPLDATRGMIGEIMAERAQGRIPGRSAAINRVLPAVQDPAGMDYKGTKILRTFLGESTPQQLIAEGINPIEAKRLYGALTKDLGNVIREAGTAPAPKEGMVRLYHGGDEAAAGPGGSRWLTPDRTYAEGWASNQTGGKVYYVDIPRNSPLLRKSFDDTGTSQTAPFVSFNAPESIAAGLKPLAGGSEAYAAWQEANALARLTSLQREALSKVVGSKGDVAPEAVFNKLATYANSKAGADVRRLRLAKQAMGPEAWSEVGSAMINRLGMAPDGTFSPQRFVTAFGNMSGGAKSELFSGQQAAALSDLFLVSKHVGERITKFANPSGTSRGIAGVLGGSAVLADPISVIGGLVGTRLVAQALAKPAIVRAATAVSRASARGNPMATRRALAQLERIVALELGATGQQQGGR